MDSYDSFILFHTIVSGGQLSGQNKSEDNRNFITILVVLGWLLDLFQGPTRYWWNFLYINSFETGPATPRGICIFNLSDRVYIGIYRALSFV